MKRMPVIFVGHGSPMNALSDNDFTRGWQGAVRDMERPRAILAVSAHWYQAGTLVMSNTKPPTIHDFYGFPQELFEDEYPAPGSPELAAEVAELIESVPVELDDAWGLDHGTWVPAKHMYPEADIPIVQLSLDYRLESADHYRIGAELSRLRDKGVLILASGNIVHNLGLIDFGKPDEGDVWADRFRELTNGLILSRQDDALIEYKQFGLDARRAVPTPDHYWPMLYALGASEKDEPVELFNDRCAYGSVSMTAVKFG